MLLAAPILFALAHVGCAYAKDETKLAQDPWTSKYGDAMGDLSFSGIPSFAHLPHKRCLDHPEQLFDVGIIGLPFDTAVSFRPGARFGPYAIRSGSRRQIPSRGYNAQLDVNPYGSGLDFLDCGDAPITPYDNTVALEQIERAYLSLLQRPVVDEGRFSTHTVTKGLDGQYHPLLVGLGGDHTVVLPVLRALNTVYGPVAVIHFDAHLDSWSPKKYPGTLSPQSQITHGSFFNMAAEEGLMQPNSSIHGGIRTRLINRDDYADDAEAGFEIVHTSDIDDIGTKGVIKRIHDRVKDMPVYVSLDIDTLDPSMAPGTGTPETGGWTTREMRRIIHGLRGLNIVGFDVVEVSPGYDTNAELTGLAAADIVFEFLSIFALPDEKRKETGTRIRDEL